MLRYRLFSHVDTARSLDMASQRLSEVCAGHPSLLHLERDHDACTGLARGRLFSGPTIVQLALARALKARGWAMRDALTVGLCFAGFGLGGIERSPTGRPCGGLWPNGETICVAVAPGHGFTFLHSQGLAGLSVERIAQALGGDADGGAIVVSMNALVERIAGSLGVTATEILEPLPESVRPALDLSRRLLPDALSAREFVRLYCREGDGRRVGTRRLYEAYHKWCVQTQFRPLRPRAFADALLKAGCRRVKHNGCMVFDRLSLIHVEGITA
jgi:hypothetical protein